VLIRSPPKDITETGSGQFGARYEPTCPAKKGDTPKDWRKISHQVLGRHGNSKTGSTKIAQSFPMDVADDISDADFMIKLQNAYTKAKGWIHDKMCEL
jgi:hypothetical protein